jgi:hypothetical protein
LRRTDTFVPVDLNLAERKVSLVGRIDRRMLADFLALNGKQLNISRGEASRARDVTCYVPVLSHPKRLLLRASQTMNGDVLPSVQRYDDSQILARDLLALLIAAQWPPSATHPPVTELADLQEVPRRLRLLLGSLVLIDPHRLRERIFKWAKAREAAVLFQWNRGLVAERLLLDWISSEGDGVARDFGTVLAAELRPLVRRHLNLSPLVDGTEPNAGAERPDDDDWPWGFCLIPDARPEGLRAFPSVESLLLHGIQDVLKMTLETASPSPRNGVRASRRAELALEPLEFAREVRLSLEQTKTLYKVLQNQRDDSAVRDFVRHLDRWVSYAVVTVRPGTPFAIDFEDIFELRRPGGVRQPAYVRVWRRLFDTKHHYPLPLKDALSVHVELHSDEPELLLGRRRVFSLTPSGQEKEVTDLFGHKFEPTRRLVHRYSSKRPAEGAEPESERVAKHRLWLEVRIKLSGVRGAYIAAATTFALAAGYINYICTRALVDGATSGRVGDALTLGTLATALALWLVTTQYRVPIIDRKLVLARWLLYVAIAVMVGSLSVYGVARLIRGPVCSRGTRCGAPEPTNQLLRVAEAGRPVGLHRDLGRLPG